MTPSEETFEGYQFEKCCEPGCTEDATFITLVEGELVCYCDAHGVAHGLDRGLPIQVLHELGERGELTSNMLLENQKSFSPVPEPLKYPDRPCDEPYHSA